MNNNEYLEKIYANPPNTKKVYERPKRKVGQGIASVPKNKKKKDT